MSADYDVIVIGAGHNGLVCAAYLAQAGERVLVLERFSRPGGCVATETVPGFPNVPVDVGGLEQGVIAGSRIPSELRLADFGLNYLRHEHTFTFPFADGKSWLIDADGARTQASIAAISPRDAEAWSGFSAFSSAVLALLGAISDGPPPDFSELAAVMRLGGKSTRALMQTFLSSPRQVVDRWFESDHVRAGLLNYASHAQTPPWRLGSGYAPSLALSGQGGKRPEGGGRALIRALVACLEHYGGVVHCDEAVDRVLLRGGRAIGVHLQSGDTFSARRAVVSAVDARRLFTQLVAPEDVPSAFRRRMANLTSDRDNIGEISMAAVLSGIPKLSVECAGLDPFTSSFSQCGGVDRLEDAFLSIRHGDLPASPAVMWAIPTVLDPSIAPPGRQLLWMAAFVPWRFSSGNSWESMSDIAVDRLLATIEAVAPDLPGKIEGRVIVSPLDWHRRTGNLAGSADHLDTSIDQMLGNRPAPDLADYRTPIRGLYLTGSGTHPGGGITGGPGRNTAREILRDLGILDPTGLRALPARARRMRDLAAAAFELRKFL